MGFKINGGSAIDLTHTTENGMTVYIGDPAPRNSRFKRLEEDGVNLSILRLGLCMGTHVDTPVHFVRGAGTLDQLPVESFLGKAVVLDISVEPPGTATTASDLEGHCTEVAKGTIVLLYTGFSRLWRNPRARRNFTHVGVDAAQWLVERGAKAVGIDYVSVGKSGAKSPAAHVALLSHGIPIIESPNENLSGPIGRMILFVCLPAKVGGCDGAPLRAMAYVLNAEEDER
jgi:arylformamidase